MKLFRISGPFLVALALSVTTAGAQIAEAYGTLSIDHLSSVELTPYASDQFSTYTAFGGTFGGTLNFLPLRLLTVGIDARDTAANGANIWLAGLQIMAKPPRIRFKPYFKLSVGEAHLHIPQSFAASLPSPLPVDYYLYNAALGIDYRLMPHLDFRTLEIGDGRTLGGGSTNPTAFLTINRGIVPHF